MWPVKRLFLSTLWAAVFCLTSAVKGLNLKTRIGRKLKTTSIAIFLLWFILSGLEEPEFEKAEEYRHFGKFKRISGRIIQPGYSKKPIVNIATAICAARVEEGMTMLKSAIIFSKDVHLNIIVFTDKQNEHIMKTKLAELSDISGQIGVPVSYELYPLWLNMKSARTWNEWFAPCSSQRLFFPNALPHIERLIYVDSDVLFVSNVLELWSHVEKMSATQLGAAAPEHELPGDGWYNLQSKIPYYGPRGLNTGIFLMNIEAMRLFPFGETVESIYQSYVDTIAWADQDILNIMFHFHPDTFYPLGCEFNYRVQHCSCDEPQSGSCSCVQAERNGARILHGNRHTFHKPRSNTDHFMRIYQEFEKLQLQDRCQGLLLKRLRESYSSLDPSQPCTNLSNALFSRFELYTNECYKEQQISWRRP